MLAGKWRHRGKKVPKDSEKKKRGEKGEEEIFIVDQSKVIIVRETFHSGL
jgi:hypothetical protein